MAAPGSHEGAAAHSHWPPLGAAFSIRASLPSPHVPPFPPCPYLLPPHAHLLLSCDEMNMKVSGKSYLKRQKTIVDGIAIYTMLTDLQRVQKDKDNEVWYSYERGMRSDEIIAKWDKNGVLSRNQGTEGHLMMELWLNSEPTRPECVELQLGLRFLLDYLVPNGDYAYATEKEIFGEEEDIAGSIDFVARTKNGHVKLIDWKRSKKLKGDMTGYKKLKEPLGHIDDCHGSKYAIQLSGYQYLFEKYYGEQVDDRILVSIYPDDPFVISVPYLKDEIEYLMECRREETTVRKKLEEMHPDLCCSQCGRLVTEAVRDANGNLWHKKMADAKEVETVADDNISSIASQLLNTNITPVVYKGTKTSWRSLYTQHVKNKK